MIKMHSYYLAASLVKLSQALKSKEMRAILLLPSSPTPENNDAYQCHDGHLAKDLLLSLLSFSFFSYSNSISPLIDEHLDSFAEQLLNVAKEIIPNIAVKPFEPPEKKEDIYKLLNDYFYASIHHSYDSSLSLVNLLDANKKHIVSDTASLKRRMFITYSFFNALYSHYITGTSPVFKNVNLKNIVFPSPEKIPPGLTEMDFLYQDVI